MNKEIHMPILKHLLTEVILKWSLIVRGTAWYSLATRGLVWGGGVGGVGRVVCCKSYSNG